MLRRILALGLLSLALVLAPVTHAWGQVATASGEDEITPLSEAALDRGLEWLARNQGPEGNWKSNDLGLVSMGALAFLAAGHAPGRGKYGREVDKALDYVVSHAKPSGLLNVSDAQRDMYNHGLATFVLGQAHGMTASRDRRLNRVLDGALKLITNVQCDDGGWDYKAHRQKNGHDLSLVVMQAKALRSAVDSGLEVPPEVIDQAIKSVRDHYAAKGDRRASEAEQMKMPGQFTYSRGGGGGTIAMAAAGVVCMQEFGQYDDWRIGKNMDVISAAVKEIPKARDRNGSMPFDAYTLYYVGQALYQVNGDPWKECYPLLREYLVTSQELDEKNAAHHGSWRDNGAKTNGHVGGPEGQLYATSVGCFILAIPNRYLPILQEGKIESFRQKAKAGK
ncbi:squalene--hopene cyclase [Anatilimnocola sp. NA78]|uniref:squalene--hopene cyclase n=1 Tax=Anatilimnocola sp. NA78 TaxID=3415683 RepID=UPI003CE5478E